jgi:hypothetical protein
MQFFLRAVVLASVAVLAQAGCVQLPGLTVPSSAAADRASVVQIFNESYSAYRCANEIFDVLFISFSSLRLAVVVENLPSVMTRWHL